MTQQYQEIKSMLLEEKQKLESRLVKIKGHLFNRKEPLSANFSEQAVELENEEVLNEIDIVETEKLLNINTALQSIEEQTYGVCKKCGGDISEGRLKALPYAALCIECANELQ